MFPTSSLSMIGVQFVPRFYSVQSRDTPGDRCRFRPRVPGTQAVQLSAGLRALRNSSPNVPDQLLKVWWRH